LNDPDPYAERDLLRRRVKQLELSLKAARQAADAERARADAATESSRRAWRVALAPVKLRGTRETE
jgi:hypothetical protein